MKQLIFILLSCFLLNGYSQVSKKALFIGNGYTSYNNIPQLIENLATANGDTLIHDQNLVSSYRLSHHSNNYITLTKIKSDDWDYVILQEQSQRPAFPPTQVAIDVKPFAAILNDSIKSNNSCSKTMFFMTWGRENGDIQYCQDYPSVCTYEGMQGRLRESYLEMTVDNNADCAPVGVAWKKVREDFPTINLYSNDGSHPSIYGSYLAACVFYTSMYHKTTVGNTYWSTLDSLTAFRLQDIASSTVLDSLSTWSIETISTDSEISNITLNDCDSVEVLGLWYFSDTLISDTTTGTGSCLNITNYDVGIGYQDMDSSISICDSVEINGNWYYSDTSFIDTVNGTPCYTIVHYEIDIKNSNTEILSFEKIVLLKTNESGIYLSISTQNYDTIFLFQNDTLIFFSTSDDFTFLYKCMDNAKQTLSFTIIAKSDCNLDSLTKEFSCDDLSPINEINNSSWQISPNPAHNFIEIKTETLENFSISLMNISGKILINTEESKHQITKLDVSTFDKGIYFLIVYDKSGLAIGQKKVIIN